MKQLPFLPQDLTQLISFVPTRGWDAVQWRPLLKELRRITLQLATRNGVAPLSRSAGALTKSFTLAPAGSGARNIDGLNSRQRRAAGDALLRFFFAQWRNPEGLFLDLRPSRLHWERGRLHLGPSGLYARLDDDFRAGMVELYRGFYLPDDKLFDRALRDLGFLHPDLTRREAWELRELVRAHFGTTSTAQRRDRRAP